MRSTRSRSRSAGRGSGARDEGSRDEGFCSECGGLEFTMVEVGCGRGSESEGRERREVGGESP